MCPFPGRRESSRTRTVQPILVLDDDPELRALWIETLTGAGHVVLAGSHGGEGLAHLQRLVPDLIVLDLQMPEMTGIEVLRRLVGTDIPVLVVSGFLDTQAAALQAYPFNIVGRLEKPVAPAELVRAVAAALASPPRP